MSGQAAVLTVDGVFKIGQRGALVTPHLDAERFPQGSPLVIDVRSVGGTSRRITGRFQLEHLRYLDGTGGFKGAVVLDPEFSNAVHVGDVLAIEMSEPNGLASNQTT